MRIAILGSTGMLGNYIYQYFTTKSQHKIFTSTRCASNSSIVFHLDAMDYRTIRNIPDVDYVINCIGCIKQKKYTDQEFYKINSIFPHILSVECSSKNIRLIHVTTDCVYSGSKGSYIESDIPDCDDVYGISKLLSEDLIHGMILRSSIIGEEVNSAYSLLSWAKSQRSSTVRGYTNHFWNGVTNLQFAKICEKIINDDLYSEGIKQSMKCCVLLIKNTILI